MEGYETDKFLFILDYIEISDSLSIFSAAEGSTEKAEKTHNRFFRLFHYKQYGVSPAD